MFVNDLPRSPSSLTDFNRSQFIHLLTLLGALFPLLVPAALSGQILFAGTSPSVNFGSVNICPAGQTTPAPCSETLTLKFHVTENEMLGAPRVLTLGAPDLDFTLANGSTCTGSVTAGTSCTANVKFAPRFTGARNGGVEIVADSGDLLAEVPVYGIGSGPQITFQPGLQSTLGSRGPFYPSGVAVDGSGNVFVPDIDNGAVFEIPAAGGYTTVKTLGNAFSFNPGGVAVDGSGNLFVEADSGIVLEIPAAGGYSTDEVVNTFTNKPYGVAVDGSRNLFVADSAGVYELLADGGYNTFRGVGSCCSFGIPKGLAVDASGNVFVASSELGTVYEVLAAGGYTTEETLGSGFENPSGVAVDASGNVYVASSVGLYEILAAGGYAKTKTVGSGSYNADGVAVDASGNIFATDNSVGIEKLDFADPPSAIFPTPTPVGSTDTADGAQTFSVWNSGNQPLVFTTPNTGSNPDYPESFPANTADTSLCAAGVLLAPGTSCDVSMNFVPSVGGVNTGNLVLTYSALNGTPATQSISLEGTGGLFVPAPAFTPKPGTYEWTQHVTLSDQRSGAVIYYTLDGTKPTAASIKYTAPIPITWQTSINAIAALPAGISAAVSGAYEIDRPLLPPIFSPPSGTYGEPLTFTLTPNADHCNPGVCAIYYTVDGEGFKKYAGPVTITKFGTTPVKAFTTEWHFSTSIPADVVYEIK